MSILAVLKLFYSIAGESELFHSPGFASGNTSQRAMVDGWRQWVIRLIANGITSVIMRIELEYGSLPYLTWPPPRGSRTSGVVAKKTFIGASSISPVPLCSNLYEFMARMDLYSIAMEAVC